MIKKINTFFMTFFSRCHETKGEIGPELAPDQILQGAGITEIIQDRDQDLILMKGRKRSV